MLRISVPPLTEERRLELVKKAKGQAETSRISIRNTRRTANDLAKSLEKDGLPEDESKRAQDMIEGFAKTWPDKFVMARSVADVKGQFGVGKVSLAMGMENGTPSRSR